ncbi:MAG: protein-glutamate O-methyltransferase CheR [Deltaproteobacteria bacterium]|nr:protein-glutamate O-methyltransferase CheR [Deltaproteobacteria bacterium]
MNKSREPVAVFPILSSLIEQRTGLHHDLLKRDVFIERASECATQAGFESLLDYYYFLRYDPRADDELQLLTEALVVSETYFFRELEQLRVIVSGFLEPLVRSGWRPRVWSAACATGEEPLTLAMLLAETGLLADVDIVASDISARALARAQEGRFTPNAVRLGSDDALVRKWLKQLERGHWQIARPLVDAIAWKQINVCDAADVEGLGAFDLILCRNVLIYFGHATVVRVLSSLSGVLKPQGSLFVGVSESLLRFGTMLSCEERAGVFFYRPSA